MGRRPRAGPWAWCAAAVALLRCGRACMILELEDTGFAANAIHLFHTLPIMGHTNGTLYIDNTRFAYKCTEGGGWHDFFAGQPAPWVAANQALHKEGCARYNLRGVDDVLHLGLHQGWNEFNEAGVRGAWRLQPWVEEHVQRQLEHLEAHPRPLIAFHVRWGDKIEEDLLLKRPTTSIEAYVSAFTERFPDVRGGTCLVVGDDDEKVEEAGLLAQEAIGCRFYQRAGNSSRGPNTGHLQRDFNAQHLEARCESTLQLLADIELLAHADYMVGSVTSGIPRVVDLLRYMLYGKERSTFMDASWQHQDWWEGFRRLFKGEGEAEEPDR